MISRILNQIVLFLCTLLVINCYSCDSDDLTPSLKDKKELVDQAVSNLDLQCYDWGPNDYYIKGFVGEDDFCYYDGVGNFTTFSGKGSIFTTTEPNSNGNIIGDVQSFLLLVYFPI